MLGAIPVPLYADAVAEEIAAVLEIAGAKLIVAQDQEQVDKMLSILPPPARRQRMCSTRSRAAWTTTTTRGSRLDAIIAAGPQAARRRRVAKALDGPSTPGAARTPA